VGNALKITPAGRVTVRVGPFEEAAVVFAVEDRGPGIPAEQRERIFEPYWRGPITYKGTGLGLAITRGIVEAHAGRIWVESDGHSGSRFLFTIPRA
jgi:signal transduction histidine kinase